MATTEVVAGGWTYQRYLELDDDERYEIIDSELLVTPSPGTRHQIVAAELGHHFLDHVRTCGLGLVLFAPTDVVLSEENVVQPDVLFIRSERVAELVRERAIHGAPDLVVEILSPSSLVRDRHRKRALYERAGVPEYWIVDPGNRAIEVFSRGDGGYELHSSAQASGSVTSRVLEGFSVAVEDVMPAAA
ncbi:MAG TPA: Uma2 family endonuclease [Longimicrobiaceae bacterium]|nr:Uma2 family endonuclease [Longimicrobiaceae bacterium]